MSIINLQADRSDIRLDQFLSTELPDLSRSQIKKLIQHNEVLIANAPAKPSTGVRLGDVITVNLASLTETPPEPETVAAPLEIVYEDADIIVVNKAAGLVVHPAHGHTAGTMVNALLAQYPDLATMTILKADSALRPGIVHRLDQDTSGLIIVARNPESMLNLQRQFKARTVEKIYLALVFGQPQAPEGIIDVPLGRDPRHRQKFAARPNGKPARTHYRIKNQFDKYSLLEIGLETGRTHQIRVHLAWLGCPVVGDTVYGRKKNSLGVQRQFLHAWKLGLHHPRTEAYMEFEAPLPADLQGVLELLPAA
jgi:23S rRNA pseudouridine1911/1915/1917 synthase